MPLYTTSLSPLTYDPLFPLLLICFLQYTSLASSLFYFPSFPPSFDCFPPNFPAHLFPSIPQLVNFLNLIVLFPLLLTSFLNTFLVSLYTSLTYLPYFFTCFSYCSCPPVSLTLSPVSFFPVHLFHSVHQLGFSLNLFTFISPYFDCFCPSDSLCTPD